MSYFFKKYPVAYTDSDAASCFYYTHNHQKVNGYANYKTENNVLCKIHCLNGFLYKSNGPAYIEYYDSGKIKYKSYCIANTTFHRADGPAIISYYETGKIKYKHYYLNGVNHRIDGPAYIEYYESGQIEFESYYVNNRKHRLDGPAIIWYDESGKITSQYYVVDNVCLSSFKWPLNINEIIEYIKLFPHYIPQISLLAGQNEWFTQDQILLIESLQLF